MLLDEGRPRRNKRLLLAGVGLFVGSISATLSATITINTENRVEFGQGIKYIDACDDWVKITPVSGSDFESGYVKRIDIEGLDTSSCKETDLEISLFSEGVPQSLSLYSSPIPSAELTCSSSHSNPPGQDAPKGCDGQTNTVFLPWNLNDTATVNIELSETYTVRALDFIGGGDDYSIPSRRVWNTQLLSCDSNAFTNCTNRGSRYLDWSDTSISYTGVTSDYPARPEYKVNPFWVFDDYATSRYLQLKLAPWGITQSSPNWFCEGKCLQVAEIIPLASRSKLVLNISSSGVVKYRNSANALVGRTSGCLANGNIGTTKDNTNRIDLDYCATTGVYHVTFHVPLALSAEVDFVTIQTRNDPVRL